MTSFKKGNSRSQGRAAGSSISVSEEKAQAARTLEEFRHLVHAEMQARGLSTANFRYPDHLIPQLTKPKGTQTAAPADRLPEVGEAGSVALGAGMLGSICTGKKMTEVKQPRRTFLRRALQLGGGLGALLVLGRMTIGSAAAQGCGSPDCYSDVYCDPCNICVYYCLPYDPGCGIESGLGQYCSQDAFTSLSGGLDPCAEYCYTTTWAQCCVYNY